MMLSPKKSKAYEVFSNQRIDETNLGVNLISFKFGLRETVYSGTRAILKSIGRGAHRSHSWDYARSQLLPNGALDKNLTEQYF